jgi:hypothetical protein
MAVQRVTEVWDSGQRDKRSGLSVPLFVFVLHDNSFFLGTWQSRQRRTSAVTAYPSPIMKLSK